MSALERGQRALEVVAAQKAGKIEVDAYMYTCICINTCIIFTVLKIRRGGGKC